MNIYIDNAVITCSCFYFFGTHGCDKFSPVCDLEFLNKNLTISIENEARNFGADVICGASYTISRNYTEDCRLEFYGTASKKSYLDELKGDNIIWEWLIFVFIAVIAAGEFISGYKTLYDSCCNKKSEKRPSKLSTES